MLHEFRKFCISFIIGSAVAGYGVHNYDYSLNADLSARMVEGGWCLDADPRGIAYLFACRDSYYAAQIQHADAIDAGAQAELNALVARTSQPKKAKKK